jgi:signal transduction histidine kinase
VVWVNELPSSVRDHLAGCGVRVTGICSPLVNTRNRRLGVRLLAPDAECVEIVTRPPADPFTLRTQPIGRLLQSDWRRAAMPTVLAKTAGVVTHKEPLMLFLQDGAEGLGVSLDRDIEVAPGDRAEAVGFTEPDGASTKLIHALVRKIGTSDQPEPKAIDILGGDLNEQDATRCKIEATYLGRSTSESMQVLEFQDLQHLRTFSAFFPVSGGLVPAIPVGSRAMLRGVLKTEVDTLPDFGKVLASFRIYANSPEDLRVTAMPSWWDLRRLLWLLAGVSTLALACVAWANMLRRTVAQRTADLRAEVEQRRRTATSLEQEIVERKRMQAQVEKTHGQLVEASRLAGKAEVASSVLHNVGNVLNSVNVSAALLAAKLKTSKAPKVARIADLLEPRQEDLTQFVATDPKGRMLPGYVRDLAKYIREEENAASAELDSLVNNVEHIKEIVAMQQSQAKLVAVTEIVSPLDLIEDALRFAMDSLTRQDVQVVREFAPNLPAITTDRHKAIQILVNLLRNAKQACLETKRASMVLTLRAVRADDRIRITIIDNGIGISAENLTRIFNFGFTTRPNGHGFGLHSSALAAKEMGGGLTASSDGQGKGAAFTLELPLQPAGPSRPMQGPGQP